MTFRHVFGEYIADPGLMARIGEGEVSGLQVDTSSRTVQMAVVFVSVVPVLCIYPFIQRYFVKGVMVGAVKG